MRVISPSNSLSVMLVLSGAPSTASEATDPARIAQAQPRSSAIRAEIGSNTEAGCTTPSPARMARNAVRRSVIRMISLLLPIFHGCVDRHGQLNV